MNLIRAACRAVKVMALLWLWLSDHDGRIRENDMFVQWLLMDDRGQYMPATPENLSHISSADLGGIYRRIYGRRIPILRYRRSRSGGQSPVCCPLSIEECQMKERSQGCQHFKNCLAGFTPSPDGEKSAIGATFEI
jgi:hypothetical protein